MTGLSARTRIAALLGALSVASGCAKHDSPPTAAPSTTNYAAVARGRVDVEGGMLALTVARPGVVAEVRVRAGAHVVRGQLLLTLVAEDARAGVAIAAGKLREAQAQAQLVKVRLTAAKTRAERLREAVAAGADSTQNADDAAESVRQLRAQQSAAEAAVQVASGQLDAARNALAQHMLTAPLGGDVATTAVQPGVTVSPQSGALITLLPDTPRIVVAEVTSEYAGTVHTGMRAQIALDADNATLVGTARVVRVGNALEPSSLQDDPALRANARTLRCVLNFDAPSNVLVGQRVLVRFLRDGEGGGTLASGDTAARPNAVTARAVAERTD